MILAALALLSNSAVLAPAVRPLPRAIPGVVTTGVDFTINKNGHFRDCVVTSTSGWPKLDSALCAIVSRSRIETARGTSGKSSIYSAPGKIDEDRMPGRHHIDISWNPPRY